MVENCQLGLKKLLDDQVALLGSTENLGQCARKKWLVYVWQNFQDFNPHCCLF